MAAGAKAIAGIGPASNLNVASLKVAGAIDTSAAAVVSSPAPGSGVAFTPSATSDSVLYVQLTAAAAGSYTITLGPTTGAENTIASADAVVIGESVNQTIYVPKGWKVVVTAVTITIAQMRVVTL